jgi:hypothetical protein
MKRITYFSMISIAILSLTIAACVGSPSTVSAQANPSAQTTTGSAAAYPIVDTGQDKCYDDQGQISCPTEGEAFYGQDGQYSSSQANYVDNGDGTVTDLASGLMWQQTPDLDNKSTFSQAVAGADNFSLAGYDDWRLPTIKELYSLMDFSGSTYQQIPYIDTGVFDFVYGDESSGERMIDAQYWSSTEYIGTTMNGSHTVFGVNFADGRIKGYGTSNPQGGEMTQFVRYVRGNASYGVNDFADNGNGTITDSATGLMWQQGDSVTTYDWESALNYCENLDMSGYNDWRLPNAKELQSIVDYTEAPTVTGSAAIDPIFEITDIQSYFWTSTTHLDSPQMSQAVYITFGQALGYMNNQWMDVHGAGAQRSDPKSGDPSQWSTGFGPQGDDIRIYNYARCVRDGVNNEITTGGAVDPDNNQTNSAVGSPTTGTDATTGQQNGQFTAPDSQNDQLPPPADGQNGARPPGPPPNQS